MVRVPLIGQVGNTPACAGKSLSGRTHAYHPRKHPRVCGEEGENHDAMLEYTETPPRVRGRVLFHEGDLLGHGNTPACAGKSNRYLAGAMGATKHPRVCGEETI